MTAWMKPSTVSCKLTATNACAPFDRRPRPLSNGKRRQVGIGYDTYGRVLARHMTKHIPGNPTIVPQNMVGAGGLTMANWFANVATRDGTVIGVPANTMPLRCGFSAIESV